MGLGGRIVELFRGHNEAQESWEARCASSWQAGREMEFPGVCAPSVEAAVPQFMYVTGFGQAPDSKLIYHIAAAQFYLLRRR